MALNEKHTNIEPSPDETAILYTDPRDIDPFYDIEPTHPELGILAKSWKWHDPSCKNRNPVIHANILHHMRLRHISVSIAAGFAFIIIGLPAIAFGIMHAHPHHQNAITSIALVCLTIAAPTLGVWISEKIHPNRCRCSKEKKNKTLDHLWDCPLCGGPIAN